MSRIGEQELKDTLQFLEDVASASDAEWGDKMSTWRAGQYGMDEEILASFVRWYSHTAAVEEVADQLMDLLNGRLPLDMTAEQLDHLALVSVTRRALVQGITIGLELHRRYGDEE